MAKGKTSFTAYCDWINSFEELSDEEAGKLIKHIFRYVNDKDPKEPDRITKLMFAPIKATLKRDLKKWEQKADINRENGKNGGRPPKNPTNPKKPSGFNGNQTNPQKGVRGSVSVSVSERDSGSDSFTPPSLIEVQNYFDQKGYLKEVANKAYEYYDSLGWKDSKNNQIKNWKLKMQNVWFKPEAKKQIHNGKINLPI